jgi:hypothetical protein
VFIVDVHFVIDSVRKLLDVPSYSVVVHDVAMSQEQVELVMSNLGHSISS